MLFHHWQPLGASPTSGTAKRTANMLAAFQALGYDVEVIAGDGYARRSAMQRITQELAAGRRFDFFYSESANLPLSLTRQRWRRVSNLDFRFFQQLKRRNVPIGLFYRDILWRFKQHYYDLVRESAIKRGATNALYWYDWLNYLRLVDHLFLPSRAMNAYMPTQWREDALSALPPGCTLAAIDADDRASDRRADVLELFFVGGIMPHRSDLKAGIDAVQQLDGVHLTLCCRQSEWEEYGSYYEPLDPRAVTIVHAQGDELVPYFRTADLFLLIWKPTVYLDFAVPIKIFESMSYGLPVVTNRGTEAARAVESTGLGWVVDDQAELCQLLAGLRDEREQIAQRRRQITNMRDQHTWQARARTVAETLTTIDSRS